MSNNPILFNAALSGAVGGLSAERWLASTQPSDYVSVRDSAIVFANAVDAAIPADSSYTQQHADLLEAICASVLSTRGSTGTSTAVSAAIAAFFNVTKAQLEAVSRVVRLLGNTLGADVDLVLLPAGHAPGFYLVASILIVRVVATAGALNRVFACNAPGAVAGNTLISGSAAQLTTLGWSAGTGSQWYPAVGVVSDGSAPIIARYTRVGITGAPVVDFYGTCTLQSLL